MKEKLILREQLSLQKPRNQEVIQVPMHGGKRLGSGRKSKTSKELGQKFFEGVCSDDDLKRVLRSHISSEDPKISFQAASWLADHLFGKATQKLAGDEDDPIVHRVISNL